jgi:hypothetical protein
VVEDSLGCCSKKCVYDKRVRSKAEGSRYGSSRRESTLYWKSQDYLDPSRGVETIANTTSSGKTSGRGSHLILHPSPGDLTTNPASYLFAVILCQVPQFRLQSKLNTTQNLRGCRTVFIRTSHAHVNPRHDARIEDNNHLDCR